MSPPQESAAEADPGKSAKHPDNGTGLPGLPTWPRVYGFVLACFVLWMVLLFLLGRWFE